MSEESSTRPINEGKQEKKRRQLLEGFPQFPRKAADLLIGHKGLGDLYIQLVCRAAFRNYTYKKGGVSHLCKPGEFLTTRRWMRKHFQTHAQTLNKNIATLIELGLISTKKNGDHICIKIIQKLGSEKPGSPGSELHHNNTARGSDVNRGVVQNCTSKEEGILKEKVKSGSACAREESQISRDNQIRKSETAVEDTSPEVKKVPPVPDNAQYGYPEGSGREKPPKWAFKESGIRTIEEEKALCLKWAIEYQLRRAK